MAQPQLKVQPREFFPQRRSRLKRISSEKGDADINQRIDSSTLASILQLQEDQRELTYSLISLFIKFGVLVIALASSLKLGLASHQRINRNNEIAMVLRFETEKLQKLYSRFDRLFSIGGKDRLMEEQDQWIEPRSKRIIWR